jgi:Raf kinase inhibitor-like YbhB/YbcL family protein
MLTLKSPAFADGGPIPRAHTCDGADLSPPLTWSGAPAATKEFALVADDPDAPRATFVHWVLYGVPATVSSIPSGLSTEPELVKPFAARQGVTDFRKTGYGGPCPPPGAPHRYVFTLYALAAPLALPAGATKAVLLDAVKKVTLEQAVLVGKYGRKG